VCTKSESIAFTGFKLFAVLLFENLLLDDPGFSLFRLVYRGSFIDRSMGVPFIGTKKSR
jgi:hypothetical protein